MEELEEPLDDLLKTLEVSLVNLLQKVRQDPWSLLIFQTLIWSFRRWAIHYLVSTDMVGSMHNYVWESHIDLVRNHAPEGLQEFGVVWLSPSNVGDRTDSLEELNAYFMFIVDKLNAAIEKDDEDEQNLLSTFLDETITDILEEWLEDLNEYRIYPGHEESSDNFPTEKIFTIMQRILETTVRRNPPIFLPKNTILPVELNTIHDPDFMATVRAAEPRDEEVRQEETHHEETNHEETNHEEAPAPPQETVASAIRRRRTMKLRAHKSSVSKTRNRRKFPATL